MLDPTEVGRLRYECDQWIEAFHKWREALDKAEKERDDARRWACKMLRERDEARDERDTFELADYAHEEM